MCCVNQTFGVIIIFVCVIFINFFKIQSFSKIHNYNSVHKIENEPSNHHLLSSGSAVKEDQYPNVVYVQRK